MELKNLINTLHPLERAVLPVLKDQMIFEDIVIAAKLKDIEVMRALQWLSNKKVMSIKEEVNEIVELDVNGLEYKKAGLPERRFIMVLKDKELNVDEAVKKAGLHKDELNICLGLLKRKAALEIRKDRGLMVKLTEQGKKLMDQKFLEESFIEKSFPLETKDLKAEDRFAYDELTKRKKIVRTELRKTKSIILTELGKKIVASKINVGDVIDTLTPKMIKNGSWKNKSFRRYDIEINVPSINGGRRHFVNEALEYVKKVWLELGFKEMNGQMIQTSFWNFDALFTAQDHPVRDMQDTFFIRNPGKGSLPEKKVVNEVKNTHEDGGTTGSLGWQYNWSDEEAKRNVLRTHTTVLSAKTIASLKKEDIPAKYFSIGKCFRNETLDWSHLFEFNQVEGIVVDPDANFRHLLGYLKKFYEKMGYEQVRIRPAYFPYTEPSAEVEVLDPIRKEWIELGGAGIFRPEVVKPLLGKDIPVLAWGLGFGRIVPKYYGITDIRELYKNDLKQLREIRAWMK